MDGCAQILEDAWEPCDKICLNYHGNKSQAPEKPCGYYTLQCLEYAETLSIVNKHVCKNNRIQSTLDISKLWGLFFTSSNYPKCKLICTSGNLDL